MDVIQDWTHYLLGENANPALSLLSPYTSLFSTVIINARAFLQLLIDQVTNKPDLTTIALLLVILFVSLKLLNILWQTAVFWLNMLRRVVFWGGLALLGVWLYTRGMEGVVEDVEYWVGVWRKDYDYWVEREKAARAVRGAMGGNGGGGGGVGGQRHAGSWF